MLRFCCLTSTVIVLKFGLVLTCVGLVCVCVCVCVCVWLCVTMHLQECKFKCVMAFCVYVCVWVHVRLFGDSSVSSILHLQVTGINKKKFASQQQSK